VLRLNHITSLGQQNRKERSAKEKKENREMDKYA
jgi:hypothetical protein